MESGVELECGKIKCICFLFDSIVRYFKMLFCLLIWDGLIFFCVCFDFDGRKIKSLVYVIVKMFYYILLCK